MEISDRTIITINANNTLFQTTLGTIKNIKILTDMISPENHTINLNMDPKNVNTIINYLRGCVNINKLAKIYPDSKKLGIDIELDNHICINIGGRIFYVDKELISDRLDYFVSFFKYNKEHDPDYSNILIDRCYNLFEQVIRVLKGKISINIISDNLSQELEFYGYKIDPIIFFQSDKFGYYSINNIIYQGKNVPLNIDHDSNLLNNFKNEYNIYCHNYKSYKPEYIIIHLGSKIKKSELDNIKLYNNIDNLGYTYDIDENYKKIEYKYYADENFEKMYFVNYIELLYHNMEYNDYYDNRYVKYNIKKYGKLFYNKMHNLIIINPIYSEDSSNKNYEIFIPKNFNVINVNTLHYSSIGYGYDQVIKHLKNPEVKSCFYKKIKILVDNSRSVKFDLLDLTGKGSISSNHGTNITIVNKLFFNFTKNNSHINYIEIVDKYSKNIICRSDVKYDIKKNSYTICGLKNYDFNFIILLTQTLDCEIIIYLKKSICDTLFIYYKTCNIWFN
ncbi:BTB/POZ domain-containing protein [Megavirus baoshan]|uniref:BTB/POZ domain-containing protein n=1 Tax=Megavirus baoshan TaxID=2496520 RepID=A0A3S5HLC5_9VIRU|nr:BTB/POZ domain-containing protein [Megavirus baoshan]AZL89573.1 BTB/POZ domain-containing protein [Megavirus baoshan]